MLINIHKNKTSEHFLQKKAVKIVDIGRISYIKDKLAVISKEYTDRLVNRQAELKHRKDQWQTFASGRDQVYEYCDKM